MSSNSIKSVRVVALLTALAICIGLALPSVVLAEEQKAAEASGVAKKASSLEQQFKDRLMKDKSSAIIGSSVQNVESGSAKTIRTVSLVLGLALIALSLYKRFSPRAVASASEANIEVVEKQQIGPKNSLLIVKVGSEHFLLNQGADETKLISKLDFDENSKLPQSTIKAATDCSNQAAVANG